MGWYVVFEVYLEGDASGMSGIECILDGVSKPTQSNGKAEFYVTTISHTYEIIIPEGYVFLDGLMTFYPFITESGSFDIFAGWPEDDPASPWQIVLLLDEAPPPNQPPLAVASVFPVSGTTETAFQFSVTGSGDPDGSIASYHWDFGDGSSSTSPNPTHTFALVGVYDVELTVTDNEGAIDTDAFQLSVSAGPITPGGESSLIAKVGAASTVALIAGIIIKEKRKKR